MKKEIDENFLNTSYIYLKLYTNIYIGIGSQLEYTS